MNNTFVMLTAFIGLLFSTSIVAEENQTPLALDQNQCNPPIGENLRGDADNGKILHVKHCAGCHGSDGKANVVVMHMDETPEDQSNPEYMQRLPDPYLYIAICKGGEGIGKSYVMSPWGDFFTDPEIKDIISWIRTFSDT